MPTKSTPEAFYAELGRAGGADLVAFVHWAVDNAPAHGLHVVWGDSGPMLKYAPEKRPYLSFTFGQLHKSGVLGQRQTALLRRCEDLHVPTQVIRDYLQAVAALIPGACVKTFPLPGGAAKELIVAGPDAGPVDWPPLAPLALHKEEWFAAIDRVIASIRAVLDAPQSRTRAAGGSLPRAPRERPPAP
jgi:hypothetical protein